MRVRSFLLAAAFACVVSAVTRPASATVLVAADLGALAADAQAIVHGRVVAATPQWLEGRRGIETLITLEIEDALKGNPGREVTFRVPGGQMGPYRSMLAGAPVFTEGDEVIVFLGGTGPAIPHLVGFSQGVYRVRTSGQGVRTVRPGVPSGVAGDAEAVSRGGRPSEPLDAFEAQVRTLVAARRPR